VAAFNLARSAGTAYGVRSGVAQTSRLYAQSALSKLEPHCLAAPPWYARVTQHLHPVAFSLTSHSHQQSSCHSSSGFVRLPSVVRT